MAELKGFVQYRFRSDENDAEELINKAIAATNRWVIRDLTDFMQFLAQNVICWDEQP